MKRRLSLAFFVLIAHVTAQDLLETSPLRSELVAAREPQTRQLSSAFFFSATLMLKIAAGKRPAYEYLPENPVLVDQICLLEANPKECKINI